MVFGAITAFLIVGAPTAGAAGGGAQVGGTVTITGSVTKDEFEVELAGGGASTPATLTVKPAATVTSTSGNCPASTDSLTGRPTANECGLSTAAPVNLVVDLVGGDDSVTVSDGNSLAETIKVNGGLGNDLVRVAARGDRTLRGEDGTDTLIAEGGTVSNRPVIFDGGTGIDTAGWEAPQPVAGSERIGVNASLVSGTATFTGLNNSGQPAVLRTDTMAGIENLSGTEVGDILTGSAAANALSGGVGNDNLIAGDGADSVLGGDGLDIVDGGKGADAIDGGLGQDVFPKGDGLDTYNTRDGYAEEINCVKSDVIVDDLVDRVLNNTATTACSVSTAAAKHLYDTHLSGRPAKLAGSSLATKISCPELKPEDCEGELEALLGKKVLGRVDYKVRPGATEKVRLPLSKANTARAAGQKIVLEAKEVDADGRDRFVSRPTRVAKTTGQSTATS